MPVNVGRLYADEVPDGSFALMDLNCWDAIVEAGSKAAFEMKLAVLGLEVDWAGQYLGSEHHRPVRRVS